MFPDFVITRNIPEDSELLLRLEELSAEDWQRCDYDGTPQCQDEFKQRKARISMLRRMFHARQMTTRSKSKQMKHLKLLLRSDSQSCKKNAQRLQISYKNTQRRHCRLTVVFFAELCAVILQKQTARRQDAPRRNSLETRAYIVLSVGAVIALSVV